VDGAIPLVAMGLWKLVPVSKDGREIESTEAAGLILDSPPRAAS
jgi:hypothetical protein